jgi:hypothetical protein
MKAIKLILIIFISALIINFIRNGRTFHIAKSLPFANAPESISIYDWACVAVLVILAWGLYRIKRNSGDE